MTKLSFKVRVNNRVLPWLLFSAEIIGRNESHNCFWGKWVRFGHESPKLFQDLFWQRCLHKKLAFAAVKIHFFGLGFIRHSCTISTADYPAIARVFPSKHSLAENMFEIALSERKFKICMKRSEIAYFCTKFFLCEFSIKSEHGRVCPAF